MNNKLIIKAIDIIILVILFGSLFYLNFDKFYFYKNKCLQFLNLKFDLRNVAFNKAINFIKKCLTSDIFKFQSSLPIYNPKISVVIPLFNCENFILRAIKSIQFQNISEIEIILIDDFSSDNTITMVKKMQFEDKRIKLLKNQKNMGILYSRSIGVLSSKGKYLFTLDNDDMFLDKDVFDITLNISERGNFDIVEFKAISNRILSNNILINKIRDSKFSHQESFILFQPELGAYPIPIGNETGSYGLRDIFLWGKCIKTEIYVQALNKFGYERYSRLMIRYEDILTNYMIFNIAESFIFVQKYGIYHIVRYGSAADIGRKKVTRNTNILYLLDMVIDFSRNNVNNKKLAAHMMIYFLQIPKVDLTLTSNKYNIQLINSCIKRVLISKYISEENKKIIKNITKGLNFIEHF